MKKTPAGIAITLGTRPEIIKMSPIIRALQRSGLDFFILHTGQHYSYNMDRVFFEQLKLPEARYNLDVGSGSHAVQTAKMLTGIEKIFLDERPSLVLVEGDTNSVFAGALTAAKMGIRVGHVEAGLRSYDRAMPEEVNRILSDHLADYCFAPTEKARQILLGEGISQDKIYVTGNTVVDALQQNLDISRSESKILSELNLEEGGYALATVHRVENVDNPARFADILRALDRLHEESGLGVVYPIHPRSRKMMRDLGLSSRHARLIDPVDFIGFLRLESAARIILTDSGGVQEEACVLKVPCVTLRDNTERPETLEVGANLLGGTQPDKIMGCVHEMLKRRRAWSNPFGDGRTGERIVNIISGASNG